MVGRLIYWTLLLVVYAFAIGMAIVDNTTAALVAVLISVAGLLFGLSRFVDQKDKMAWFKITEMDRQLFSKLVSEAVNVLPEEFAERLENVDVIVEDQPWWQASTAITWKNDFTWVGRRVAQIKRGLSYAWPSRTRSLYSKSQSSKYSEWWIICSTGRGNGPARNRLYFGISDDRLRLFETDGRIGRGS